MKLYKLTSIISLISILYLFFLISNAFAISIEVISPEILSNKLDEGEQVNFTLKIKDIEYEDINSIKIVTNLIVSENKPIYNFEELNKYIDENRYQPSIELNLSSLPKKNDIYVTITGDAPNGEIRTKCNDDIVLIKFQEGKLKLYEIYIDDKLVGVETFELKIKRKEIFEKTMQEMKWDELDNIKYEIRNLFILGLSIEAQNLATELTKINRPDHLSLFKFIKINNNLWLNIITLGIIIVSFVAGYLFGSKNEEEE